GSNTLLIRLVKILRQSTTTFVLLGAHQSPKPSDLAIRFSYKPHKTALIDGHIQDSYWDVTSMVSGAFTRSDVRIEVHPAFAGRILVTSLPRMSGVRSSNPGTAIGFSPVWRGFTRIIAPGQEDDCSNEGDVNVNNKRSSNSPLGMAKQDYRLTSLPTVV
ncbi:hypothetical protein T265_13924, partial [Opisthorchis viverrini]